MAELTQKLTLSEKIIQAFRNAWYEVKDEVITSDEVKELVNKVYEDFGKMEDKSHYFQTTADQNGIGIEFLKELKMQCNESEIQILRSFVNFSRIETAKTSGQIELTINTEKPEPIENSKPKSESKPIEKEEKPVKKMAENNTNSEYQELERGTISVNEMFEEVKAGAYNLNSYFKENSDEITIKLNPDAPIERVISNGKFGEQVNYETEVEVIEVDVADPNTDLKVGSIMKYKMPKSLINQVKKRVQEGKIPDFCGTYRITKNVNGDKVSYGVKITDKMPR